MKRPLLLILFLLSYCALNAQNRSDLPSGLQKFDRRGTLYKSDDILKNMIGDTISFIGGKHIGLYRFKKLSPDTIWIKEVKSKKRAKLNRDYTLDKKYKRKSDGEISGRQFYVKKIVERVVGAYNRDFYSDVYLYDINNEKDSLIWSYHNSSNHRDTNNPKHRIKVNSASKIANALFVNNDSLYLYTGNGYNSSDPNDYIKVKCTECDFYINEEDLNISCDRKYVDENNIEYVISDIASAKLITPSKYDEIKKENTLLMKAAGKYALSLVKVEKPSSPKIKYGKTSTSTDNNELKYTYRDNYINIMWFITSTDFNFILSNKSPYSLRIVWDEAVYVNEHGIADKVFHTGVKYSERNNPQPHTVVLKDAMIQDILAPTSKVYSYSGGFGQNKLFDKDQRKIIDGKTIRISLPIQIEGVINEYIFTFKIKWEPKYPELQNIE